MALLPAVWLKSFFEYIPPDKSYALEWSRFTTGVFLDDPKLRGDNVSKREREATKWYWYVYLLLDSINYGIYRFRRWYWKRIGAADADGLLLRFFKALPVLLPPIYPICIAFELPLMLAAALFSPLDWRYRPWMVLSLWLTVISIILAAIGVSVLGFSLATVAWPLALTIPVLMLLIVNIQKIWGDSMSRREKALIVSAGVVISASVAAVVLGITVLGFSLATVGLPIGIALAGLFVVGMFGKTIYDFFKLRDFLLRSPESYASAEKITVAQVKEAIHAIKVIRSKFLLATSDKKVQADINALEEQLHQVPTNGELTHQQKNTIKPILEVLNDIEFDERPSHNFSIATLLLLGTLALLFALSLVLFPPASFTLVFAFSIPWLITAVKASFITVSILSFMACTPAPIDFISSKLVIIFSKEKLFSHATQYSVRAPRAPDPNKHEYSDKGFFGALEKIHEQESEGETSESSQNKAKEAKNFCVKRPTPDNSQTNNEVGQRRSVRGAGKQSDTHSSQEGFFNSRESSQSLRGASISPPAPRVDLESEEDEDDRFKPD